MIKQQSKWGFVCGRISVLETRLVSQEFYATLLSQEHMDDLIPHLQDTFLKDYLGPGSPWEDFSSLTDRCFFDFALSLREDCPKTTPVDLLILHADYLNLKNALIGQNSFPFRATLFSQEKLAAIASGDNSAIPEIVLESGIATLRDTPDKSALDAALDSAYLRHVLSMAQDFNNSLILTCTRERVLTRAISVIWRAIRLGMSLKNHQQYFQPCDEYAGLLQELINNPDVQAWPGLLEGEIGGLLEQSLLFPEDEQVAQFELLTANYLACIAREGIYQTAGPEHVFAFLIALYAEMQNIKLVVCGRLNRVSLDLLRRRLRMCYG